MKKFEYQIVGVNQKARGGASVEQDTAELIKKMNQAGKQGWRFVPDGHVIARSEFSCLMERVSGGTPVRRLEIITAGFAASGSCGRGRKQYKK